MKILMTTDTVGGVWTYAVELARSLREQGVQIALATMGAPLSPQQRRQVELLDNLVLHESSYKLEWMQDPWQDVDRAGRWLLELEAQVRPAVVHLNGYAHGSLPLAAPLLLVAHSCVLSWWQAVKGEPAPAQWQTYRDRVAAGLRGAEMVVAPSRAMLASVQRHYGPLPRTRVICNGRDPSRFAPHGRKQPFILSAGRLWDQAKNLAALEGVAARVSWPIRVAGDAAGPEGGAVAATRAQLLGRKDEAEMAKLMAAASIYALPAKYEPFGLSALEAALSGCALVLSDIPSLREIWGDAAEFVPPDDQHLLAATLQRLIDDPRLCMALAQRAQQRAARFTAARMADSYLRTYQQLVRGHVMIAHDAQAVSAGSTVQTTAG